MLKRIEICTFWNPLWVSCLDIYPYITKGHQQGVGCPITEDSFYQSCHHDSPPKSLKNVILGTERLDKMG